MKHHIFNSLVCRGRDPDKDLVIPSVLIRVQTVCKGYQQTTKASASKERVRALVNERSRRSSRMIFSGNEKEMTVLVCVIIVTD